MSQSGDRYRDEAPDQQAILVAAHAVAAEAEEREGIAMYLALPVAARAADPAAANLPAARTADLAAADPPAADRAAIADGSAIAAALRRYLDVLGLDTATDPVQHAVAALAWRHIRGAEPTGAVPDEPLHVPPGYTSSPDVLGEVVDAFVAGRLVRAVNYHNTPLGRAEEIEAKLRDYARRYESVTPTDIDDFARTGRWNTTRPAMMVAFYDGFHNAVTVGAQVCDALGLTAWFYPPTAFLDTPAEEQRDFAARNEIYIVPEERDGSARLAMTWDELGTIAERHVVCGHTASHALEAQTRSPADVDREVVRSLQRIEQVTGRPAGAFAWLGGTPYDEKSPGCRAVRDAGVPFMMSGLLVQRL